MRFLCFIIALLGSASASGFQMVVNGPNPKALDDFKVVNIQVIAGCIKNITGNLQLYWFVEPLWKAVNQGKSSIMYCVLSSITTDSGSYLKEPSCVWHVFTYIVFVFMLYLLYLCVCLIFYFFNIVLTGQVVRFWDWGTAPHHSSGSALWYIWHCSGELLYPTIHRDFYYYYYYYYC